MTAFNSLPCFTLQASGCAKHADAMGAPRAVKWCVCINGILAQLHTTPSYLLAICNATMGSSRGYSHGLIFITGRHTALVTGLGTSEEIRCERARHKFSALGYEFATDTACIIYLQVSACTSHVADQYRQRAIAVVHKLCGQRIACMLGSDESSSRKVCSARPQD
jgi:hypothetical protein